MEHCDDCGVCIYDHDHHCPWTSKCIGGGNIYIFYAFVTTTLLYIVYMVFALIMGANSATVAAMTKDPSG